VIVVVGLAQRSEQPAFFELVQLSVPLDVWDLQEGKPMFLWAERLAQSLLFCSSIPRSRPSLHFSVRSRLPLRCGTRERAINLVSDFGAVGV
jgi:hypothetical protein